MISQRTASFRPRARLVSILGEHLISDHVVGLLELVKNAFDADATLARVELLDLADQAATRIIVTDDGFGMTLDEVVNQFLCPAADHKAREKRSRQRTPAGRLPIGEKGVGRFAVQQLGHRLRLITRAQGQPEVLVDLDWDDFEGSDTLLQEVTFPVFEREPEVFLDGRTGTQLTIQHARTEWNEAAVRKLQQGLRRLRSPLASQLVGGNTDFNIEFVCPAYPDYQSLDTGDLLDRAHYMFTAVVDAQGQMEYEYRAAHPDPSVTKRHVENERNLLPDALGELSGPLPSCGAFYFNLYVWDRSAQYLQQSGISRKDLDVSAGVSLFRDHLRVLPYGEAGDDWLFLDRERINDPSRRLSNNQVVGFVEVSQEETPELRDKTNREGLIDNPAFRDLRAMVRAGISFFHTLWLQDRPTGRTPTQKPTVPAAQRLQQAQTVARAIESTARPDISVELPYPTASPHPTASPPVGQTPDSAGDLMPGRKPLVVSQQVASRRLISELERAIDAEQVVESERQAQADILLHLAATGMAAERVVHEFGRQVVAALDALEALRKGGSGVVAAAEVLAACLGTLRNEFRVLAPYEGVNRFQRAAWLDLQEAIGVALLLNETILRAGRVSVEVEGDSFEVFARPASLIQVFDNLLHNASIWASHGQGEAEVRIRLDAAGKRVIVGDSGPGVPGEVAPIIFDPFVSTRAGGRGLGLYITRNLLAACDASVELCTLPELIVSAGANFLLDFSRSPRPDRDSNSGF